MRERRTRYGKMGQIDGSLHTGFKERGLACNLLPAEVVVNQFECHYNTDNENPISQTSLPVGWLLMGVSNEWANPSAAGSENLAAMLVRLEDRARCPDQQTVNSTLMDVLKPLPGEKMLEVGCGSGVLCRLAAPGVGPTGKITGIDISYGFVHAARSILTDTQLEPLIEYSTAQAGDLPFTSRVFDKVFAARLLLHVADPQKVVKEMARVVKPAGRLVLMDWDFDTVAVDHSNRELTRRLVHWRTDCLGGDNWSGRKLFHYLAEAGLSDLQILPVVSIARSERDSLAQSLWNAARIAREQKIFSAEEYETWIAELKTAVTAGHFYASIVYFIVSGKRL